MIEPWIYSEKGEIFFPRPLLIARIVDRPNRFIVNIEINGEIVRAHCPTTGSVGSMTLNGLEALVSGPYDTEKRSTAYTLEALRLPNSPQWIGVNQTQVNRYVQTALTSGALSGIQGLDNIKSLKPEPRLGGGRLDFLVNNSIYIEAKMPLKHLQLEIPDSVPHKLAGPTQVDRMIRQLQDITVDLKKNPGSRALFFTVFCYNNPGFLVPKGHDTPHYRLIQKTLQDARTAGLEQWQLNFSITPEFVKLEQYFLLN